MDTSSTPLVTDFEFIIDGNPETPVSIFWADSTTLTFGTATSSYSTAVWRQIVQTPACRGTDGSVVKLPQSQDVWP